MITEVKAQLRSEMKARRLTFGSAGRDEMASQHAARHMLFALAAAEIASGSRIALYWPLAGELDPRPLMEHLIREGFALALPVVIARATPLVFRDWQPGAPLVDGAHGVRVPPAGAVQVRPDVVVTPLLAFDDACMRLGYGGGYYDRTLGVLRHDGQGPVRAFGYAYDGQHVDHVPVADEDAHLDAVVTDKAIYWSRKDAA